ncbi:HAD-IIB family hydrolase [Mycoplasmopsis mucosicanis]|uniref:HAD-IIB family hydrolase n=1 Tax=Mycoplasmopsis mucosicanis TaxID=458208 RepID=A0A507SQR1_9BACT|nr:HAD-IIB family hydrolase [Mycoplasmopsis mucosicanis]TQC51483.1 HAD-IIB family hydrolase [Mycoplasmopsis mucosicanis]
MKIKDVKIVFIDLDGTTLDDKKNLISQQNIAAINRLTQKGIEVVVSTGRAYSQKTKAILEKLNSVGNLIAWNGAKVFIDNKEILSSPIPSQKYSKISELVKKYKMTTIANSDFNNHTYTNNPLLKLIIWKRKGKINKINEINLNFDVFKFIFTTPLRSKTHRFFNELLNEFGDELNIAFSRNHKQQFIEVTNYNSSKGDAEILYATYRGVDAKNCVHIGDTMNDSTTVGKVGHVIALNNATNDFKKIANYISPFSYKKGGLAKTIEYFFE